MLKAQVIAQITEVMKAFISDQELSKLNRKTYATLLNLLDIAKEVFDLDLDVTAWNLEHMQGYDEIDLLAMDVIPGHPMQAYRQEQVLLQSQRAAKVLEFVEALHATRDFVHWPSEKEKTNATFVC